MNTYGLDLAALEDEHGLPRGLVRAVAMTESAGDPNATSPAGAAGLMQLMPGTAKELGVDPYDGRQSLVGGARYLGQQLRRFGGDIEKALAAYNAGPGRVAKGGVLPRETQQYIPKVLGRLADADDDLFSSIYGKAAQMPQEAPAAPSIADDDLFQQVYGSAPSGRSQDVPPGIGEPGYMGGRDPDVPPGVGEPGYSPPPAGRPPLSDFTNEDVIGSGWKLLPPRAREDLEPFIRGATAPVRADAQNLAALLPGAIDPPAVIPGEESDPRYIIGNIASGLLVPGLGPATIPRAIASGVIGATMQPTGNPDHYLKDKAMQAGLGGAAGGAVGALARAGGHLAGAIKGKYADPGIDEIAQLAKQHNVPLTAEDLARARTDPTWRTKLVDQVIKHAERRLAGVPLVGPNPTARHTASLQAAGREAERFAQRTNQTREHFAQSMDAELPDWLRISPPPAPDNPKALVQWVEDSRQFVHAQDDRSQGLFKLIEHVAKAPKAKIGESGNQALALLALLHEPTSAIAAGAAGKALFTTTAGQRLLYAANQLDVGDPRLSEIVHALVRLSGTVAGGAVQSPAPVSDDDLFNAIYGDRQQ